MSTEPIVLTLYDENDEIIGECRRSIIPWGLLKKALKMKDIKESNIDEKTFDELGNYVCELFGNKYVSKDSKGSETAGTLTTKELDKYADITQMLTIIKTVVSSASGYFNNPN